MNALFTKIKQLDPMLAVAAVLLFAVAFMLGQQTTSREYIVDASEIEVVFHDPYKNLTLDECVTDWECETAQLLADNRDGKLVRTDDPIFFPDTIPVIEPIDYEQGESPSECETGDKECEKANKLNAGKPAHYPAICEPYIFSNELSEETL